MSREQRGLNVLLAKSTLGNLFFMDASELLLCTFNCIPDCIEITQRLNCKCLPELPGKKDKEAEEGVADISTSLTELLTTTLPQSTGEQIHLITCKQTITYLKIPSALSTFALPYCKKDNKKDCLLFVS